MRTCAGAQVRWCQGCQKCKSCRACDARLLFSVAVLIHTLPGRSLAPEGYELLALTIRYGQTPRSRDRRRAGWVARALGVVKHIELDVNLEALGGSALVGEGDVPKDRPLDTNEGIPSTYVPARNTIFLSLALAWAEVAGAGAIVIGVNALDYSGYPDCRPEYLEAFERLCHAGDATRASRVRAREYSRLFCA